MIPLLLPPGVQAQPTKAVPSGSWSEGHLMRWADGRLSPMGGFSKLADVTLASPCRRVHVWRTTTGVEWTAFLCEQHVYVLDKSGVLSNVSPTVPLPPPAAVGTGGWGTGKWGRGTWGTPRVGVDRTRTIPVAYCMDNWGEDLLVMSSADGRLLRWSPATPEAVAAPVAGAPTGRMFVVTPERFVMMFGLDNDPRAFGWCDQENVGDWNFASTTNKAGKYEIEPAAPIVAAVASRDGVLFWSARKLYLSRYVGLPAVYSYEEICDGTTPISPASVTASGGAAFWASDNGFWRFDGGGVAPVACAVRSWIEEDIDKTVARHRATMARIDTTSEIWWFFPQEGQAENTRAVIYNPREDWWSQARVGRSAGSGDSYASAPLFARGTEVFKHEQPGGFADADPPWIETFPLALDNGDSLMTVLRLLPDIEGDADALAFTLYGRVDRAAKRPEISQTKTVRDNGWVDFRITGRDFRLRIAATCVPCPAFTVGQHLLDVARRGQR